MNKLRVTFMYKLYVYTYSKYNYIFKILLYIILEGIWVDVQNAIYVLDLMEPDRSFAPYYIGDRSMVSC